MAKQINDYLAENKLVDKYQSAYRMFHSTETALLKVQNDILTNMQNRRVTALVMLDLSAAFDTIDHSLLFQRLETRFGISGTALKWIKSYLCNRSQCVSVAGLTSSDVNLEFGVPQGSVLGPLLFTLYVAPLADIAKQSDVDHHMYMPMIISYTLRSTQIRTRRICWIVSRIASQLSKYGCREIC